MLIALPRLPRAFARIIAPTAIDTAVTCTSNIGVNPAAGAATFTIASFAVDGTTVKDASAALGSYSTFAYPMGVVRIEYTDATCGTVKPSWNSKNDKVFGSYICVGDTSGYRPTSATGGEYGVWGSGSDCTGSFSPISAFTYKTDTAVNCVTQSTNYYYTYQAIFPDTTATKVGVDQNVLDDTTCATPYWQGAPLTGVCTAAVLAGSTTSVGYKFYPLAAGVLADGGFSASKSVAYAEWYQDTTCAGAPSAAYWGGVYPLTDCSDTDAPPRNFKFCEDAACPSPGFSALSVKAPSTLNVGATPAAFAFQMTVGMALVTGEKVVVTADKAVWAAAAGYTSCTIDGTAQTADAAVDATMKILTLTMTSGLAAGAGTCALHLLGMLPVPCACAMNRAAPSAAPTLSPPQRMRCPLEPTR